MIAVISIDVVNLESAVDVNRMPHAHRDAPIGRMGIPYRKKNINIISVAVDAGESEIAGMKKELGEVSGIRAASVETAE